MKYLLTIAALILYAGLLDANVEVLSEKAHRIEVQFNTGEYSISETNDFSEIIIPGLGETGEPGAPSIPEITYYIGIPENGHISFEIIEHKSKKYKLSAPLIPVPQVIRGKEFAEYKREMDEELYRTRHESFIRSGEPQRFRYNYVVPLTITPLVYRHNLSEAEVAESMNIVINIYGDTADHNLVKDSMDLSPNILNYSSARKWQYNHSFEVEHAPFNNSDFWYRFEIAQNGMHKLTSQDLNILPLSDIDPSTIRIFTTGGALIDRAENNGGNSFREIPLLISNEENGIFGDNDYIIFYAENRDGFEKNRAIASFDTNFYYNPYSRNGVYWLTYGGNFTNLPKRIRTVDHTTHQITSQSSPAQFYYGNANVRREHSSFEWYHSSLSGLTDSAHNFNFSLGNVDPGAEQKLTVTVRGYPRVSNNYGLSMVVNETGLIERANWSRDDYQLFSGTGSFIQEGENKATLTIHRRSSSIVFLDYFTIDYRKMLVKNDSQLLFRSDNTDTDKNVLYRIKGDLKGLKAFEIEGTHQTSLLPIREADFNSNYDFEIIGKGSSGYTIVGENEYLQITGFQAVIPKDLTSYNRAFDCIIIKPEGFAVHADRLAEIYASQQGLSTLIVRQQDIFNQFNGGMPDPAAINLFIRYAFNNYLPDETRSLSNVIMLGSGTIDWRNFSGQAADKNKLILYQNSSETSDDLFTDMSGNNLPDIAVGRITGQNDYEMSIIIGKISDYWLEPTPGLWRNTTLIVADDEFTTNRSSEYEHTRDAQLTADMMSPAVVTDKVFGIEHPFDPFGNKPTARNEIVSKINEGRLIWYYIGHGNYDLLGHESYFRAIDVQALNNRDKLPMFIAASCDVGKFDYFAYNSLSERLLAHPNGGSIASLAATGLSSSTPNHSLMYSFLRDVVNYYQPPGIALMQAKHRNQAGQNRRYAYLGDPILPVVPPHRLASIELEGKPDSLFALQRVKLEGSFIDTSVDNNKATISNSSGTAEIIAYGTEPRFTYTVETSPGPKILNYSKTGNVYFRGNSSINNNRFQSSFIIPADIRTGNTGRIIAYNFDDDSKKDYVSYYYPVRHTNITYQNALTDSLPPAMRIWLNDENFRNTDIVPPNPVLYAEIEDESGINISGEMGHKILIIIDEHSIPIDATSGFTYETDSYTKGKLIWQLSGLKEGEHNLQLVVFDNYNNPAVGKIDFVISSSDEVIISDLLPYPNPISDTGSFTFRLSNNADVNISIYTIRGRRIRTLKAAGITGFNQVKWDGRDREGSRLANNTYIYKIRARQPETGKVTEKIGKVIVLK